MKNWGDIPEQNIIAGFHLIMTIKTSLRCLTHPLPTTSRSACRLPWCAAHSVGVIPSSSGALRSLRVASFSSSRWPSRAARWYLSFIAAAERVLPDHWCSFGACFPRGFHVRSPRVCVPQGARAVARGGVRVWPRPLPTERTPETREREAAVTGSCKADERSRISSLLF